MIQSHQSFACLFAVDPASTRITHASANCAELLGQEAEDMLGADLDDLFGREMLHALRNAAANPAFATRSAPMSGLGPLGQSLDFSAFASGPSHVVECRPKRPSEFGATPALHVAQAAMTQLLPIKSETSFAEILATQLRRFSGADHVLLWLNAGGSTATVMAESRRQTRDSAIAAQLPWADLWPRGAHPVGLVSDMEAPLVPILRVDGGSNAALNLGPALSNPPQAAQADAMAARDMRASTLLRLSRDGRPWGVLECLSPNPRIPSTALISLCDTLLPFIDAKLQTLDPIYP